MQLMRENLAAKYGKYVRNPAFWKSIAEAIGRETEIMTDKNLTDKRREWQSARLRLINAIRQLGFPAELGHVVAQNLGSTKAMERMISYLTYVKPRKAELVVDEMLAICSEIDAWREKKASEAANASYNEMLYYGLGDEEDEDDTDTGEEL